MRINRLALTNFRRFAKFDTSFHENLTVFVAKNGDGKTSVLDGIATALGTFVGAFDKGKGRHFLNTDATYRQESQSLETEQQYPVRVSAEFSYDHGVLASVSRELTSPKSRTTIKDAAELTHYGKQLMTQVRDFADVVLPVISYYPTGRLWSVHKDMQRKKVLSESRTLGYEDCLTPSSNFKQLQQWMGKATLAVMQQQQISHPSGNRLAEQIEGIKLAVDKVLEEEGWSGFHYNLSFEELAMDHVEDGLLPVSLLSDGVRAMVSLVADMAWRCAKLNPQLGKDAPSLTPGIVLIDEVDLHLHPTWQQRVIGSLTCAFPLVQFVVTTHSPQVLTTVDKSCIRLIRMHWDAEEDSWGWLSSVPDFQTRGVASYEALARIMGINPIPEVEEAQWIADYTAAIENGTHDDAQGRALREKLLAFYGADHPVMLDADRLIRFQSFKLRKQMANKD